MTESPDVLISLARTYLEELSNGTFLAHHEQAFQALCSLIRGQNSPAEAIDSVRQAFHTDQPVKKILSIMQMTLEPVPTFEFPMPRSRQKAQNWTENEDQRLIAAIELYGLNKWRLVSQFVGNGRTQAQCSQRWNRGLNPEISKAPWTQTDERKLVALVEKYGKKNWRKIAKELKNRSDAQCRYRYQQMERMGLTPKEKEEEKIELEDLSDSFGNQREEGSQSDLEGNQEFTFDPCRRSLSFDD
jgi:hypothetical protein